MRLEEIVIRNFKGLRDAQFEPTKFSCLVGENNAGKSTVLQAIAYALNRPNQLSASLFHDLSSPVEFTIRFSGITDAHLVRLAAEHRSKIAPLVDGGRLSLITRYQANERLEVKVIVQSPSEPRYRDDAMDDVFRGKKGKAVRGALVESYPEFAAETPEELSISAAKDYLRGKIRGLGSIAFEAIESPLPSGISSSVSALLPEPIYIPAVKNLSDDLKTTQSTSFGRLLGLLLEDMTPDLSKVSDALRDLNKLLNRVEQDGANIDGRHQKVRDLETLIESLLGENFPRVKVELRIPPPELRAILNSAQIFVDDGSRDLIDNKGDGIKRSLTFALLRAYVELLSQKASADPQAGALMRPLIFLFEEPELYLHPKSQKVLFDTLGRISDAHQVVVTTHSPLFFAPGVTAGFVRVAKQHAEPKPIGVLFPVNFELDPTTAEVFRLAKFENADAGFFCTRVVLFEGESDDAYFRHISKLMKPEWDFDKKNVALIRVSGKGNFAKYRTFFGSFGIQIKIVADLDAFFEGYQHLCADAEAESLRSETIRSIDARITAQRFIAEPSSRQIRDRANQESFRRKFAAMRAGAQRVKESKTVDEEFLGQLDELFAWEQEIRRVQICQQDAEARAALVPTLDALRTQGICVLSKGAIEDYYPAAMTTSGPKPERALRAAKMIESREQAMALSSPLAEGRQPELFDIFTALFDGL